MARRTDTHHDGNGYGYSPVETCSHCRDADPQVRTRHHLQMVRNTDLDTLRAHLTEQWVTLRDEEKKRTDLVDDVCRWVSGLIEEFSGFPDPATGASMPWWQARQMQAQSKEKLAKEAYAKAPEGYRARAEGRPVPSFHRARVTPEGKMVSETKHTTPVRMREPGEDVEYDEEESGVLS